MPFNEKGVVWPNAGGVAPQLRPYQRVAASFANSPSAIRRGGERRLGLGIGQPIVARNNQDPIFTIQREPDTKHLNYSTTTQYSDPRVSLTLPPPLLHLTSHASPMKQGQNERRKNPGSIDSDYVDDDEDDDANLLLHNQSINKTIYYDPMLDNKLRAHRDLGPGANDVSSIEKALIDKIYNFNHNNKFEINDKHSTGAMLLESKLTNKESNLLGPSPPANNNKALAVTKQGCGPKKNWPKSLCVIIRFYRFFGFSFSGLIIPDDDEGHGGNSQTDLSHSRKQTLEGADKLDNDLHLDDYYRLDGDNQDKRYNKPKLEPDSLYSDKWNQPPTSARSSIHLERYLFIGFNILVCAFQVCLYVYGNKDLREQILNARANNTLPTPMDPGQQSPSSESGGQQEPESSSLAASFVFDIDEIKLFANKLAHNSISEELVQLKPILKNIIESLAYVFLADDFLNLLFNLIMGGRLLCQIVSIVNVERFDRSPHLAKRLIGGALVVILMINSIGIAIFNRSQVWLFIRMMIPGNSDSETDGFFNFEYDDDEDESTLFARKGNIILGMKFVMHLLQFTSLALVPILFVYSMLMFKANMNRAIRSVQTVKSLNEPSIMVLKDRISELNEQFKSIVRHFSIPLTISFINNTFMIIGSSCFLMINPAKNQYYMTFIFNIGMLAFVRLVVISYAGNIVATTGRHLIRTVYESLHQWELNEWICFMELKQLRKDFIISIFSTYQIRQASILTMLGFALNYIVILLQTESSIGGKQNNATVIVNASSSSPS